MFVCMCVWMPGCMLDFSLFLKNQPFWKVRVKWNPVKWSRFYCLFWQSFWHIFWWVHYKYLDWSFLLRVFRCLLNIIVISLENKMAEQLQQMKKDRRHMEKSRGELIKKAKGLLEQNKLRRYHGTLLIYFWIWSDWEITLKPMGKYLSPCQRA